MTPERDLHGVPKAIGPHGQPSMRRAVWRPAEPGDDECVCRVSAPDPFGNRDIEEADACPVHGTAE